MPCKGREWLSPPFNLYGRVCVVHVGRAITAMLMSSTAGVTPKELAPALIDEHTVGLNVESELTCAK